MIVFFDTSVLVAGSVAAHPHHSQARSWIRRAKSDSEIDMIVAGHTLAEMYAVLTTLPVSPRIAPHIALRLIEENAEKIATNLIVLDSTDYLQALHQIADQHVMGGTTYDALAVKAAEKGSADQILTFNQKDFLRLWPGRQADVVSPFSQT